MSVFVNISSLDKLAAYSLSSGGCQSLARVRQSQLKALVSKFQLDNIENAATGEERRKRLFRSIIKARFNAQQQEDQNENEVPEGGDQEESEEGSDEELDEDLIVDYNDEDDS